MDKPWNTERYRKGVDLAKGPDMTVFNYVNYAEQARKAARTMARLEAKARELGCDVYEDTILCTEPGQAEALAAFWQEITDG